MRANKKSISYTLAFGFVAAVAFIYLFIAIALVPYWQEMSGTEIQSWWSGPFARFAYLMVPIHLLSIITSIYGYILRRKDDKPFNYLWLVAPVTLLIYQVFNFGHKRYRSQLLFRTAAHSTQNVVCN